MTRESRERVFFKQPSKRKEAITVTAPTHDKKRRAREAYRSSNRSPARERREQPYSRGKNRRGYKFADEDVKEMNEDLLKHGKIKPLTSRRPEEAGMTNHPRYGWYHQLISHSTQDRVTLKNLLQEFLDKRILLTKEEERPRIANVVSTTFSNCDPIEISKGQPAEDKKWGSRTIDAKDEKKRVCNMIEKESEPEENRDPMEVEVMNTWLGWKYVRRNDDNEQALENPATTGNHKIREYGRISFSFTLLFSFVVLLVD